MDQLGSLSDHDSKETDPHWWWVEIARAAVAGEILVDERGIPTVRYTELRDKALKKGFNI